MRKWFELRFFRGGQEVPYGSPLRCLLDPADVEQTFDLLTRHLYGAVERSGALRTEAHLFYLEVREVDRRERAVEDQMWRWALPIDPQEVTKWR